MPFHSFMAPPGVAGGREVAGTSARHAPSGPLSMARAADASPAPELITVPWSARVDGALPLTVAPQLSRSRGRCAAAGSRAAVNARAGLAGVELGEHLGGGAFQDARAPGV